MDFDKWHLEPLRIDGSQCEDTDWRLYVDLIRDVCFLYHELSEYQYIMWDLDYQNEYSRPYWELLNRIDTGDTNDRFIRAGILVLFMAMLRDEFEGSGVSISRNLDEVQAALERFIPEDNDILRLADAVSHGVKLLRASSQPDDQFAFNETWAYNAFVRKYFEEASK